MGICGKKNGSNYCFFGHIGFCAACTIDEHFDDVLFNLVMRCPKVIGRLGKKVEPPKEFTANFKGDLVVHGTYFNGNFYILGTVFGEENKFNPLDVYTEKDFTWTQISKKR